MKEENKDRNPKINQNDDEYFLLLLLLLCIIAQFESCNVNLKQYDKNKHFKYN